MTTIEILISVVIIALCLSLLFTLLIQVRNEENNNNIESNFKISQASFIRQIEEDIINYGVKAVTSCDILSSANIDRSSISSEHASDFKCVEIYYAADYLKDNIGFILIYNNYLTFDYDDASGGLVGRDSTWVLSYQRGHYKSCGVNTLPVISSWTRSSNNLVRELPSEIDLKDVPYIRYTAAPGETSNNAASLVIPIVNLAGDHYDLNLSFTFKDNTNFICGQEKGKLECKCLSNDNNLCSQTIADYDEDSAESLDNIRILKGYVCPSA